jgi:uncharacterized protein with HEPN domain
MPRDSRASLEDLLDAIGAIRQYTSGLAPEAFAADRKTVDAVLRNLEVIGFGIDLEIIWDVVSNKLPALEARIRTILDGGR